MTALRLTGLIAVAAFIAGEALAGPPAAFSEQLVEGPSKGNHALDCTVIRPWREDDGPDDRLYPVIGWLNGWDQGDVLGETTTEGYKPGLIEWALDGPYIVIAANAWSAREDDVLRCLDWLADENDMFGGEYEDVVDLANIGLAGHSQGGGGVIKAGDGEPNGFDIAAVVAMNPYGPAWVNSGDQDGPVLLLGGTDDTTTPVASFIDVWFDIQDNGVGGVLAVLDGGTHNSEAWGVDEDGDTLDTASASLFDFGQFQKVTELWWRFHLNDDAGAGRNLKRLLNRSPWDTEYAFTEDFDLAN